MEPKRVREAIEGFRDLIARIMLDDLEVREGLLQPKKEDASSEGKNEQMKRLKDRSEHLTKAAALLEKEFSFLPPSEKIRIEEEMVRAKELADTLLTPYEGRGSVSVHPEDTFQKILGFSNQTLFWVYSIAQQLFVQEKKEEAFVLFELLTALNPVVCDYWIAQGLSLRGIGKADEALYAFTMASLMEPEHPVPRYNAAELYLEKNQVADARIELDMLEDIIEMNELIELKPSLVAIKARVNKG